MMNVWQDIQKLWRAVERLRQDVLLRPLKSGGGSASKVYTIRILGGNTLSDGSTPGIKFSSSAITSVPSAYDPDVDTSFIDGIGRGILFINGTQQSGNVLIVHHSTGGSGLTLAIPESNVVLTNTATVSIPVAGDPNGATVSCYVPYTL
jgi:hypothetical protein